MNKALIDRRKFIQRTGIGSAAMFMAPALLNAASVFDSSSEEHNNLMSGLTPISVIDNACMLAFCSGKMSGESQAVLSTDIHLRVTPGNKGRLAVVMPPGNPKIMELILTVKKQPDTANINEKRALVFGWVAVNSVDRHINSKIRNKSDQDILQSRFHQDALIIRGFSAPEFHLESASKHDIEDMLNAILVRTITRVHTLKPDSDDGIGWVNRMAEWRRTNKSNMEAFASAIASPDRSKAGETFYHIHDNIVVASNALQKGQLVGETKFLSYLDQPGKSDYGKAINEATRNIMATDQFFQDKLSLNELEEKLLS